MSDLASNTIREWRVNPRKFVFDCFGATPDEWQGDALDALGGQYNPRRRLAMSACTGPGKSTLLAWVGWHRLACFADKGEHPKGIALSGEGWDNLSDNLWSDLSKWQQRSEFLTKQFKWNAEKIYQVRYPQTWMLSARSYPKGANPEQIGQSISGLHGKFPFILLDEIGAMPIAVVNKATQIFTGGAVDALICGAGNPTSVQGALYYVFKGKEAPLWVRIKITADPDDPKRTPRVDVEHAREQIRLHGRENPWIMATILGEFPPGGFNQLLSIEDCERAMERHVKEDQYSWAQKRLGIDVARFGDDRTVLFPRQGLVAFKPVIMRGARTEEIVGRAIQAKFTWGSELEFVDGTGGWGSGVIDALGVAGHTPQEIVFSSRAPDSRYYNMRAYMHFKLAEWIKKRGVIPRNHQLAKELAAATYTMNKGRFLLEPKEQIKERLGFSPDMADALALTFAQAEAAASLPSPIRNQNLGRAETEYDPFKREGI